NIITPYVPTDLEGADYIERLVLQETRGEKLLKLDVDSVLCNYGFVSKLGPIADWGLDIHRNSIEVNQKMETNIQDIYTVSDMNIITPYVPTDLEGADYIERLVLQETRGEKLLKLDVDSVLCNYGFVSKLGPIADWGLDIHRNSIEVNQKMETNIPGIYAVGDINTYDGKVKLIATGFGEGPTAINNAMQYMNPKARVQPRHSTSMF